MLTLAFDDIDAADTLSPITLSSDAAFLIIFAIFC